MLLLGVLKIVALSLLSAGFGWHAVRGLTSGRIMIAWRRGVWWDTGERYERATWGDRRRSPFRFWLGIALFGGLSLLLGASVLIQIWLAAGF